jgi:hypothetical protein
VPLRRFAHGCAIRDLGSLIDCEPRGRAGGIEKADHGRQADAVRKHCEHGTYRAFAA